MLPYILSFAALAVFPTALAGIGGHLATLAVPDPKQRRFWLCAVWVLAGIGILLAGLQQAVTYRSDQENEKKQDQLQSKLNANVAQVATSLQKQEYMRGQLDTVAGVMGQVLNSVKGGDPNVKAIAQAFLKTVRKPPDEPKPQDALRKKVTGLIADLRASDLHAKFGAIPGEKFVERRAIGRQFYEAFNVRCYEIAGEMEKRNMKSEGQKLRMTCGGAISDFGQDQIESVIGQLRQFAAELP